MNAANAAQSTVAPSIMDEYDPSDLLEILSSFYPPEQPITPLETPTKLSTITPTASDRPSTKQTSTSTKQQTTPAASIPPLFTQPLSNKLLAFKHLKKSCNKSRTPCTYRFLKGQKKGLTCNKPSSICEVMCSIHLIRPRTNAAAASTTTSLPKANFNPTAAATVPRAAVGSPPLTLPLAASSSTTTLPQTCVTSSSSTLSNVATPYTTENLVKLRINRLKRNKRYFFVRVYDTRSSVVVKCDGTNYIIKLPCEMLTLENPTKRDYLIRTDNRRTEWRKAPQFFSK